MKIAPHLAEQLLETNFENICGKLKAGGTLTVAESKLLQESAKKQPTGPAPVATSAPPPVDAAPPEPEFQLETPPVKFTAEDYDRFGSWYEKGPRQLKRWVEEGKLHADPCPLNDPATLPAWWARRMTHRCPAAILDRAAQAKPVASPQPSVAPTPFVPADGPSPKIDLSALDPEEGDRLRELKQVQSAKFRELANAFATGNETAHLESRYVKLCEAVDKMESRVVERLKKQGRYILRDEVEAAIAANAELLRQSHESMKRRILERCPSLTAVQRIEVGTAVEVARASEIKTLSRVHELTDDDLELELAS